MKYRLYQSRQFHLLSEHRLAHQGEVPPPGGGGEDAGADDFAMEVAKNVKEALDKEEFVRQMNDRMERAAREVDRLEARLLPPADLNEPKGGRGRFEEKIPASAAESMAQLLERAGIHIAPAEFENMSWKECIGLGVDRVIREANAKAPADEKLTEEQLKQVVAVMGEETMALMDEVVLYIEELSKNQNALQNAMRNPDQIEKFMDQLAEKYKVRVSKRCPFLPMKPDAEKGGAKPELGKIVIIDAPPPAMDAPPPAIVAPPPAPADATDTADAIAPLIENIYKLDEARALLENKYIGTPSRELARHIIETIDREILLLEITNQTALTFEDKYGKTINHLQNLQQKRIEYAAKLNTGNTNQQEAAREENMTTLIRYSAWYRDQEKKSGDIPIGKNPEDDRNLYAALTPKTHGFLPYLRALIRNVGDGGFFEGSDAQGREVVLVQRAIECVGQNLKEYGDLLASTAPGTHQTSIRLYENAKRIYVLASQELAELTAGAVVSEDDQSPAARNGKKAEESAKNAISHMNMEEAFAWVKDLSGRIDRDNWQSKGVSETYAQLYMGCKAGLYNKLQEMKAAAGNDPQKLAECRQWNLKIAYHFTGRRDPAHEAAGGWVGDTVVATATFGGSTNSFDADFADTGYSAELAKEAMDFENLALHYMEKNMAKENPLKAELSDARKKSVLDRIPLAIQADPRVAPMIDLINGNPTTVEGMSAKYATIRNLESIFTGENANIQEELEQYFGAYALESNKNFQTFLEGGKTGSISKEQLIAACGTLTQEQIAGWELLADMEGHGWFDWSDTTVQFVGTGAKIAAMIAAGIALSAVTAGAGMGVVASALASGVGMTATSGALFHGGFDNAEELKKTYGKDLVVNTATMGAARYAQAARYLYQAKRAGDIAKGYSHLRSVWAGGTKYLSSLDEMAQIGSKLPLTGRVVAATVESGVDVATGTLTESAADIATGTSMEQMLSGGEFVNNLVENCAFAGLGYGEFIGPAVKGLKNASMEQVQRAYRYTQSIGENLGKLKDACKRSKQNPQAVLNAAKSGTPPRELSPEEAAELMKIANEIVKDDIDLTSLLDDVAKLPESNIAPEGTHDMTPTPLDVDVPPAPASAPKGDASDQSRFPRIAPGTTPDGSPAAQGRNPEQVPQSLLNEIHENLRGNADQGDIELRPAVGGGTVPRSPRSAPSRTPKPSPREPVAQSGTGKDQPAKQSEKPAAKPENSGGAPEKPKIRLRPQESTAISGADGKPLDLKGESFIVKGKDGRWYTADRITRRSDGRYNVYQNSRTMGSFDAGKPQDIQNIQLSNYNPPEFKVGDSVFVTQFVDGQADHYGPVTRVNPDGTVYVKANDTLREHGPLKPNQIYMLDKDGNVVQKHSDVEETRRGDGKSESMGKNTPENRNELVERMTGTRHQWENIRNDRNQPTLTRELLQDEACLPKGMVEIQGKKFYIGSVIQPKNGYQQVVMFVEENDKYIPRILYKSQSAGGWRSCPFTRERPEGGLYYSKGMEYHYTQETKPDSALLAYLEENSDVLQEGADYLNGGKFLMSRLNDEGILDYSVAKYDDQGSLAGIQKYPAGGLRRQQFPRGIPTADVARVTDALPAGFIPDFHQGPMKPPEQRQHTLLGVTTIETYQGTLNSRPVIWEMAYDQANRVWIDGIYFADSTVNSHGVRTEVIDTGFLTSKPLDYGYRFSNIDAIDPSLRIPFNQDYEDMTLFIDQFSPIRAFRSVRGLQRSQQAQRVS